MSTPKFCLNCAWSKPEPDSSWGLRCHNPAVNKNDSWALGSAKMNGTSCTEERGRSPFAVCGKPGRQYKEKSL